MKKALLFLLLLILSCSKEEGPDLTGSGSRAGNAMVSGSLVNPDGSVAANALVSFIPVSQDPTASIDSRVKITTTTDEKGAFRLDNAITGKYNAFGDGRNGNVAFVDSIAFDGDTASFSTWRLKPSGGLKAVFRVQPVHDPRLIDVIFWGTELGNIMVDRDGNMAVNGLAEGTYPVRIKLSTEYGVIDTNFVVESGLVKDLDTIALPYLTVPVVTGLQATYDTLSGRVSLAWDPLDTAKISGYNVYRGVVGYTFPNLPINSVLLHSPFYVDSPIYAGNNYLYRIKGLDKNGDVGPVFSLPDTVWGVSCSLITTQIEIQLLNGIYDTIPISNYDSGFPGFRLYPVASINDTCLFVVSFQNPSRTVDSIVWFIDSSLIPIKGKSFSSLLGKDTLRIFWTLPEHHYVSAKAIDAGDQVRKDSLGIQVLLDVPKAFAGQDTMVKISTQANLHGSATDRFGRITEWAWDIGNTGVFTKVSRPDTAVTFPDSNKIDWKCILRVTDDDNNQSCDTVQLAVLDFQAAPVHGTGYAISDIALSAANVSWNTDHLAFPKILYGETPECPFSNQGGKYEIKHSIQINGLSAATLYFTKAISINGPFNDTSGLLAFTTRYESPGRFNILRLPSGVTPIVNGDISEWRPEYMLSTISGDENVFARTSDSILDPSREWNGELYAAYDGMKVYFAVKVTVDDVYRCGGSSSSSSDNIKVNQLGKGTAFYVFSNGILITNPSCPFNLGATLFYGMDSIGNNGLPVYEFALDKEVLAPFQASNFQLSVGAEDYDSPVSGQEKTSLGFGVYGPTNKNDFGSSYWDNASFWPTYIFNSTTGPALKQ